METILQKAEKDVIFKEISTVFYHCYCKRSLSCYLIELPTEQSNGKAIVKASDTNNDFGLQLPFWSGQKSAIQHAERNVSAEKFFNPSFRHLIY